MIEVAYVKEYGLDATELSCINLLLLINTNLKKGFQIFGNSDERYKIQGGNNQITEELAKRIGKEDIQLEHRLVSIRQHSKGFRLTFATLGKTKTIVTDFLILTLPFTLLREVDAEDVFSQAKLKSIRNLRYGTNTKLILSVDKPIWRECGQSGECYSDQEIQTGCDSSRQQAGAACSYTFFLGGSCGIKLGTETVDEFQTALNSLFDIPCAVRRVS